ncbi:hypothetical protein EZV62_017015 [Acer yangbiense]|uniref:Uncharacterized protein n=1 Tax=Acer yangbiense TaxID=1000413 RepID=A0A5C7HSE3_9ROSI|nr:hypothetical protein EZV62_017015 [Acer yangbiense]
MVDVIISVAAKVAELLVVPIGRHILYPFKYKSNMEELTIQVEKLTDQRDTVQHSVDEATRQGDEIEKKVEKWLNRVDEFSNGVVKPTIDDQVKAGKLCSIGFCPNLMARYSLSKKAVKTTKDGVNLLGEGTFEKRPQTLRIFKDKCLTFQEESLSGRADRLRDRLKKEKRLLLVLDNIWAKLDLEVVGIPFGHEEEKESTLQEEDQKGRNDQRRCKILLTSRSEAVLTNDMNVQKNFLINILSDEDAGNLFWKTVGDSAKQSDFDTIGIEIVQFCAGLPVAVATIASALKKMSLFYWKDALNQLRSSNPRQIKGMEANVYSAIKLSYNFLESEEAKSVFLLCSLHNASYNIYIEDLLKIAMGLCLFQDVSTLEQGRNRLYTLINNLKASSLLLDGRTSNRVKMHDIIHVVATSIASTDKFMFNIQNTTGLKEILEEKLSKDATAVSLFKRDICELPERLKLPKLNLLILLKNNLNLFQIPNTFFEGMKELKILDLTKFHLLSLPSSLQLLTKLQTLYLYNCVLGDIATIGALTKLEVLTISNSDIEHLPGEIRQLTRLRLLDMSKCQKLTTIAPGVVSSLTRLEELYMGNSFVQWDANGQTNASLTELKQLSHLTTLEIHILDARIMPQDLLFGKLDRYRVFIGDVWDWFGNYETSKTLKLKWSNIIYLGNGIKTLLNRTEDLYLDELKGAKNVLYVLDEEGFPQLKHLHVQNGSEIQYIINSVGFGPSTFFPKLESLFLRNLINLEMMCHDQLATESFSKLRIMKVKKCDRLKHLFSFSMAKNLLKLEEIEVTNCKKLEEIVFKESHEQFEQHSKVSKIEFTQLRTLRLQCLPQLTSFGSKEFTPDTGSQEILAEDERGTMSSCCQTLTSLTLELCSGNLKFLFSYSMVKSLVLLEKLKIQNCKSIEGIINIEELRGEGRVVNMVFPKLINLQLKGLPNLTQFASGNSVEFPSLTQLSIQDCPKLKAFATAVMSADKKQSEEVEEMNCQDDIHPLFDQKNVFPLTMFGRLQKLGELLVDSCNSLEKIFEEVMMEEIVAKEEDEAAVPRMAKIKEVKDVGMQQSGDTYFRIFEYLEEP